MLNPPAKITRVTAHEFFLFKVNSSELDPMSRVTGIPGWYWILGIKCSDTTGVGLVYWNSELKSGQGHTPILKTIGDRSFQDRKESCVYNSVNSSCWVLYICFFKVFLYIFCYKQRKHNMNLPYLTLKSCDLMI